MPDGERKDDNDEQPQRHPSRFDQHVQNKADAEEQHEKQQRTDDFLQNFEHEPMPSLIKASFNSLQDQFPWSQTNRV
jgi:hypothetical protein